MQTSFYTLGLMSGSSLDGLDLAYCRFDFVGGELSAWQLLENDTLPFSDLWQARLRDLPAQSALILAKTDIYFGYYLAELVDIFRQKYDIGQLDAIASHGHTVFHEPARQYTLQIGSGAALSARSRCTVISDFRQQDIANGGQGAPLAPMADRFLFANHDFYLNLGGIANLAANMSEKTIGFDVCYANQVLNFFAQKLSSPYDKDGNLAKTGQVDADLLATLKNLDFFQRRYPKSLGNDWVQNTVLPLFQQNPALSPLDALATATEHISFELAKALQKIVNIEKISPKADGLPFSIFATGGGAHNTFLMQRIAANLAENNTNNYQFAPVPTHIIDAKEAILMAFLGALRLHNLPNMPTQATGANFAHCAGAIYSYLGRV
jgi:anhydro-N-acetylmuramic acid kinase